MKKFLIIILVLIPFITVAQVGIGTTNPDASAALDISSNDSGLLTPRLTTTQRNNINSPANGLLIYNISDQVFQYYSNGTWYTLSSAQDCGFANFPDAFTVNMDIGATESVKTRLQQTVGTPGNLTTALVYSDPGFDVTVNNITPNNVTVAVAPGTTEQTIAFTLGAGTTASVGDVGQAIFQIVSDCGEVAFVTVNINVTGCEFEVLEQQNDIQYVTKQTAGSIPVNFTFDIAQAGTNPGNVSLSYTTSTPSNITEVVSPSSVSYGGTISFDLDVPSTVIAGTYEYEMTFVSDCNFTVVKSIQVVVEAFPRDCKQIKTENPSAADGVYQIDPDGVGGLNEIDCYCDMTTDGGGWTMVLNYVQNNAATSLIGASNTSLPLLGSSTLGDDESTSGTFWGHAGNSLMNKFDISEVRFYGESSRHSRILHFKHDQQDMIDYFQTGSGSINVTDLRNNFTALTGHNADIPSLATGGNNNKGNNAMVQNPFGNNNGGARRQWHLLDRWRMDDNGGNGASTIHRIFIR